MTREEIKNTPELVDFMLDSSVIEDSRMKLHKRLEELCELASKALEQQPCKDTISRQAVLSEIETVCFSKVWAKFRADNGSNGTRDYIINYIKQLPPVQKEITTEDVEAYCKQRNLVVITKELFDKMNNTADKFYLYLQDEERRRVNETSD